MAPLARSRSFVVVLVALLPLSFLGIIFTLMFTFCIQCSCCLSCCCCEPFEFAALVTSSPLTPHILETDVESQASVVPNNILFQPALPQLQPALPQVQPALPQLQAQQVWFHNNILLQPAVGLSLPQLQAQQQIMTMPTALQHQYTNVEGQLVLLRAQQDHLQLQLLHQQQQQALPRTVGPDLNMAPSHHMPLENQYPVV